MERLWLLFWNRIRTFQTLVWLALLGVTLTAAQGIAQSVIDIEPSKMTLMTLFALFFGTISAVSKIPRWLGILSVVSLGIEYLLLFWSHIGQHVGGMILDLRYLPNVSPISQRAVDLNEAFQVLAVRAYDWWATLDHPSIIDPLIPQLLWGLGIWLSAVFLAWSVWKRQQTILGVLPIGVLLGFAAFFSGELYNHMALYLLFIIVLQASSEGLRRQNSWQTRQIDYATALSQDLVLTVVPLAIIIVGIAFYTPSFSINRIAQNVADLFNWNDRQSNAVASSLGLRTRNNPFTQRAGLTGLPRSHLLGNSPDLGQQRVMTIFTGELASIPYVVAEEIESVDVPRHYWQSAIYDRYTSNGWVFSTDETLTFEPNTPFRQPPTSPGREVTHVIDLAEYAPDLLHTSGMALSVNQPVDVSYRPNGEIAAALINDDSYTAVSWLVDTDLDTLRAAGTNYPRLVEQSYLQLPSDIPLRVRNLALELTAGEETVYDKALALETYLREFPYNLEVQKPPPNVDVTDYFLFELQEGYCDYYATSMAVLARAAGIPARFVIGYISSYYDYEEAVYYVSEAEAHSWVQIYFPGVGWVNFEPTGGRPPIERRENNPVFAATGLGGPSGETALEEPQGTFGFRLPTLRWRDLAAIHPFWWFALAAIALFLIVNIDFWRLRWLSAEDLSQTLYQRLLKQARLTGLRVPIGDTPYEFARKFITHLNQEIEASYLARFRVREFWRTEIYPTDEPTYRGIRQLAQQFVRQRYAPPNRYALDRDELLAIWEELDPELTRAVRLIRLTHRYPNLFKVEEDMA